MWLLSSSLSFSFEKTHNCLIINAILIKLQAIAVVAITKMIVTGSVLVDINIGKNIPVRNKTIREIPPPKKVLLIILSMIIFRLVY